MRHFLAIMNLTCLYNKHNTSSSPDLETKAAPQKCVEKKQFLLFIICCCCALLLIYKFGILPHCKALEKWIAVTTFAAASLKSLGKRANYNLRIDWWALNIFLWRTQRSKKTIWLPACWVHELNNWFLIALPYVASFKEHAKKAQREEKKVHSTCAKNLQY